MSLVTMKELLQDAKKRKYAVGSFNVFNFETLNAAVEVAEELKTPLVLGIPERLFKFVDVDTLGAAMVGAAQKSSAPIALHLDHGHTYEGVLKAIRWGFTSVMFDGSALPFADNVKITKEITKIAHSLGISVEGELGYFSCNGSHEITESNMVKPQEAEEFVRKTHVDALAVAVGNIHGAYKGTAKLNFSRLSELSAILDIPLVLHGGARLTKEEYKSSIEAGVSKINIATDMSLVAAKTLKDELTKSPEANYIHLMMIVKKGVKDRVRQYMLYFDCISKAAF